MLVYNWIFKAAFKEFKQFFEISPLGIPETRQVYAPFLICSADPLSARSNIFLGRTRKKLDANDTKINVARKFEIGSFSRDVITATK